MRLLPSLRRNRRRLAVIGLDGVPHSFIAAQVAAGQLPNIARLLEQGSLRRIDSIHPTVSCVAWASFATGVGPGAHGIYGFTDRRPGTYNLTFPNADNLGAETLWARVAAAGRPATVLNVPVTYPPSPSQGLTLVSGFLAPRLRGATAPASVAARLRGVDYRIDVDATLAATDIDAFLTDAAETLEARKQAALMLMRDEWELFVCHFMTPDRVNHFLWPADIEAPDPGFTEFYARLDAAVGEIVETLRPDDGLMILSDHGFTRLKAEVHLNAYLRELGLLTVNPALGKGLAGIAEETTAFSMTPGRIYFNLEGREVRGSLHPRDLPAAHKTISEALLSLADPVDGTKAIDTVADGADLFSGMADAQAPGLLALPADGYDLKSSFSGDVFRTGGTIAGMHTYDDALLYVREHELADGPASIIDVSPTVLDLLGEPASKAHEGRSLLG